MADNALYRRTKQRFVEQFDRPVPQDYDVVERASLFPVATYGNGQTGIAWPGIIVEDIPRAFTAPSRAYNGELGDYLDNRDAYLGEGLNFAGNMAVGGSVVPRPTNSLASNVVRLSANRDASLPGTVVREAGDAANGVRGEIGKPRDPNTPPIGAQREGVQSRLGRDAGTTGLEPSSLESILSQYGLPYTVERSSNFSSFGPSSSVYYHVETPSGRHTIRLSDHNYASPSSGLDFRFGDNSDLASGRIAERFGVQPTPTAATALQAQAERLASFKAQQDAKLQKGLERQKAEKERMNRLLGRWSDDDLFANSSNSTLPGTVIREAGDNALSNRVRGYHGTNEDFTTFDPAKMGSRGNLNEGAFFFSKGQDLANAYAEPEYALNDTVMRDIIKRNTTPEGKLRMDVINKEFEENRVLAGSPRVIPGDIDTSNFGNVNLRGYDWQRDDGARLKSAIDKAKAEGKSGIIINGMKDGTGIVDTQYAVWGQGTVRSPMSGDVLFANAKQSALPGTIVREAGDNAIAKPGIRAYHGSPHDFDVYSLPGLLGYRPR